MSYGASTGTSIGDHVQTRIAEPLGLDLWIGLPAPHAPRVEATIDMSPLAIDIEDLKPVLDPDTYALAARAVQQIQDPDSVTNRGVYINGALIPADGSMIWNDPRLWAAAWPAATCITNARSLARMYAATVSEVDGVRLLDNDAVDAARTELSFGPDATTVFPSRFGHGFHLHHEGAPLLGPGSFGHGGMGGSQAFADVDHNVGFGYVMNQMQLISTRVPSLVDALRACL